MKINVKITTAKLRAVITASVFMLILGGFFIASFFVHAENSESERRPLKKLPDASFSSIVKGEFMNGLEEYADDHFAARDTFRMFRAISTFYIFGKADKDGLYYSRGQAGKIQAIDEDEYKKASEKLKIIADFMNEKGSTVYWSFVPDKSVYAGNLPGFDTKLAYSLLSPNMSGYNYIDISSVLNSGMFYPTDLHWDQSKIVPVARHIAEAMGRGGSFDSNFAENTAGSFRGVYYGQLALPIPRDTMIYLTSDAVNGAKVEYINNNFTLDEGQMYYTDKVTGGDPYDFFLNGVYPIIQITNPSAETDRELIIFRDSFTSSLAPLLVSAYGKITLIDLRMIDFRTISRGMYTFLNIGENVDTLILYSSQVLNTPGILNVTKQQ